MTPQQLREFARLGAEARLRAIAEERETIWRAFPQLRDGAAPPRGTPSAAAPRVRGPRRSMSATKRRAVGERMRAYWAKRRAAKTGESAPRSGSPSQAATNTMSPGRQAQAAKMRAYWAARRAEQQTGGRKTAGRKAGRKK